MYSDDDIYALHIPESCGKYINVVFKQDVKALLGFLKAKVLKDSKELEKSKKFAYNRGLIDEKGNLTLDAFEVLAILSRLFPNIDFSNDDMFKLIDINKIVEILSNVENAKNIDQLPQSSANSRNDNIASADVAEVRSTSASISDGNITSAYQNQLPQSSANSRNDSSISANSRNIISETNINILQILKEYYEDIKEDLRQLAIEQLKEKTGKNNFGKVSFYDILKWLLEQGQVDVRYIAEHKKELNASPSSYRSDLASLRKIDWIYEDVDGLYKLNTEKFLRELHRSGILLKIQDGWVVKFHSLEEEEKQIVRDKLIETYEKYKNLGFIRNGVFSFEFGDETLEQYYLSSLLLNRTKAEIDFIQRKYFDEWYEKKKDEFDELGLKTVPYPILKYNFRNIPFSARESIQYPKIDRIGKLVVVEADILEVTSLKNIVVCAEYKNQYGETKIIYFDRHEKKIKNTIKEKIENKEIIWTLNRTFIATYQELLIQQPVDKLNPDEVPKPIKAVWYGAEGIFAEGSKVRIVGILDKDKSDRPVSDFMIHVLQLELIERFSKTELSEEDIKKAIEYFKSRNGDLRKIADDLLPNIRGSRYEKLKLAILLQQAGLDDTPRKNLNPNLHILIVSDPGLGKTQILRRIEELFPNNVYVDMQNSTPAGLLGAMERRKGLLGEGWVFERGALPLANGGTACLDEQPNKENIKYLNEAMENGRITVTKASKPGLKIPACFATLMAMNPIFEKFDREKTLIEQIRLPASTLSRFDVIFSLFDVADEDEDDEVFDEMLSDDEDDDEAKEDVMEGLRKYLLYAQTFKPKIPKELREKMKKYLKKLRKGHNFDRRIANSLKKLVIKSAQAHLRDVVTEDDFRLAVSIFEEYLYTFTYDSETGLFDVGKILGVTKKDRDKLSIVYDTIVELSKKSENGLVSYEDILNDVETKGIKEEELNLLLNKLKSIGDIYEPRPRMYGLL